MRPESDWLIIASSCMSVHLGILPVVVVFVYVNGPRQESNLSTTTGRYAVGLLWISAGEREHRGMATDRRRSVSSRHCTARLH